MNYRDTCSLIDTVSDNVLKFVFMGIVVAIAWKLLKHI